MHTTKPHYKKKELHKDLKTGIWLYFLLLIFEGALRKWILPGLAAPLLIIRDPIAIWLIIKCWQRGLLPSSFYLNGIVIIGIISVFIAIFWGHGNLIVAVYGARILVFHFPLVFIIGKIFTREDVIKIGIATLWITIPMAVLIALQFYSPQSAFVNRGVGGDTAGAGYDGAMGFYRPPATFSFTTGTTSYFSYAACFIFYFWFDLKKTNKLILIAATLGLFAAIPLSISRSLFFQTGLTLIFLILAVSRKPKYFGKLFVAVLGGAVIIILLSQLSMFKTATEAFTSRFTSASGAEGGLKGTLGNRAVGGLVGSIAKSVDQPILGYGIGMGTNAGGMLLANSRSFLIAEGEWAREVGELGPILGLSVIFIRIALAVKIAFACYKKLAKDDILPWLLLSYGLETLADGNWAQPTYLGFYVMIGGLILASLNNSNSKKLTYT
ncbi:MAG: hypothetical protein EOP43_01000 [Sphingobacteriaceae bacterium]|nr:MAG: hypothetical protein EOP43_01000 [Sphingobacteriaceae bacterium]